MNKENREIIILVIVGIAVMLFLVVGFLLVFVINQRKKLKSQKHAAELELQSLRAQLNPHFMFNSLNAIQELILKEDFDNSYNYLARFAKLLRMILENTESSFLSLQKELETLQLYLSLEKLRMPDLEYHFRVDETVDPEQTKIPNMILQPYIENAIWHGLSHKQGERKLEVNVHKQNGTIQYEIKDNGVGRKRSAELKSSYRKQHKSKGMELLSRRFSLIEKEYGAAIQTKLNDLEENGKATGTQVEITIPDSFKTN